MIFQALSERIKEKTLEKVRLAARGILTHWLETPVPQVQTSVLEGERFQDVEWFQQCGFSSRPPLGAELIMLPVGGGPSHVAAIASADRDYPCPVQEQPGEACMHDILGHGDYIHISKDRVLTAHIDGNTIRMSQDELVIHHKTKIRLAAPIIEGYADQVDWPDYTGSEFDGGV